MAKDKALRSAEVDRTIQDLLLPYGVKKRLRSVEEKLGIKGTPPTVTGSTEEDKIDSLISALAVVGIIKDLTT